MSSLMRWSAGAWILGSLWLPACSEDDSDYDRVAQGRYAEIWQSVDLEGRVCPQGAAEIDRQIEELASSLRVSVPEDYRIIARIEPSDDAAGEACGNRDLSGCLLTAKDSAGSPLMISGMYVLGHETVHAVQRLRSDRAHRALLEGEARMFEDFADNLGPPDFCRFEPTSEARIQEAFEEPLGAYGIFHETVTRVYQDYGPEAFDMLWAASADDPSDEGLLAAFESVLGTTLFELMQQPSPMCRHQLPGCAGLEQMTLTSNVLTVPVPQTCDEGTSGLEPGRIYHSFVLELDRAGDLTVAFSRVNGIVNVGACDGFEDGWRYGNYNALDYEWSGAWAIHPVEAGRYRVLVLGQSDGPASEARFELMPD